MTRPAIALLSSVLSLAFASDEPSTWREGEGSKRDAIVAADAQEQQDVIIDNSRDGTVFHLGDLISTGNVPVGAINCRYSAVTGTSVTQSTCMELANEFEIELDDFFVINPTLHSNCRNIRSLTEYCVSGCALSPRCPWRHCAAEKSEILIPTN